MPFAGGRGTGDGGREETVPRRSRSGLAIVALAPLPSVLALAILGLLIWLLLRWLPRARELAAGARRSAREEASARHRIDARREQLRAVHHGFSADGLADEALRLRRELAGPSSRLEPVEPWLRLIALEGPQTDAWIGLARALLVHGRGDGALRCAAEAVRAGHAQPSLLLEVAEALPPAGAGPVAEAFAADRLDPARLGVLYQRLDAWTAPLVPRALLWRAVLDRVTDREERARQRERPWKPVEPDPELVSWIRDAWPARPAPLPDSPPPAADRQAVAAARAAANTPEGLAAWLRAAHALDAAEERPTWPEARAAFTEWARRPAEGLAGEPLAALAETLAWGDVAWAAAVETALLARRPVGTEAERRLWERLAELLPAARAAVHTRLWLAAWQAEVTRWLEELGLVL